MVKNNLTPEESLDVIQKHISNFKMNYRESAKVFLLWGWVLTLASFSNFIILKILHFKEAYSLMGFYSLGNWIVYILIGFVIMFFMIRKMNRNKKVFSHIDKFVDSLWWVTVASFFVGTFICIRLGLNPPPLMLLIAGLATTTTGLIIKFRPIIFGGMAFFLFSVAATFVSNEYIALIVCAAIICGYLIPGYLLKFSKE